MLCSVAHIFFFYFCKVAVVLFFKNKKHLFYCSISIVTNSDWIFFGVRFFFYYFLL